MRWTKGRAAFAVLFITTAVVYGTIVFWSLPRISAAAGGLAPFDLRPAGYGVADADAFLRAISDEGVRFFLEVQHRLDLVYPPLFSATLFFALSAFAPDRLGTWRWLLAAMALPIMVFDFAENGAVAQLLRDRSEPIDPVLVEAASRWTVWKSALTTVAISLALVLGLVRSVNSLRSALRRK